MSENPLRYDGRRWTLVFGAYAGVEQVAVQRLNATLQSHLPYVVKCVPADAYAPEREPHVALIGTPAGNPWVAKLAAAGRLALADHPQAHTVTCMDSPWAPGTRLLVVAGRTEVAVLHGVVTLRAQLAIPPTRPAAALTRQVPTPDRRRQTFDTMGDFCIQERPRIENRGIWTWGYVVYDYRRFLDNMARLKLNMLTLWNDCPPVNIGDVIAYARSRGVKVVLGFPWGWGMDFDLAKESDRTRIQEWVLREYESHYAGLDIDGIYFQTQTEHRDTTLAGRSTAELACEMVNAIGGELLRRHPALNIQFGLHATSIQGRYTDLAALDPRIMIVWEDAGALPFAYGPELTNADAPQGLQTFEQTLEYATKLATLRKHAAFGMVPKGWMTLDWWNEFEHHGPFLLGERDAAFIAERLAARQVLWDRINTLWLRHYPFAIRFYREILKCAPASVTVTGLVEDGLFEERIQPSVALFAETIWNPEREPGEILEAALSAADAWR